MVTLEAVRVGEKFSIRIPADTVTTGGTDKHVTIIQPNGYTAYDAFKLEKVHSTLWRAQVVVVTDLRASGQGEGVRAARVPAIAGLIRSHEVAAKRIPHALAVGIPTEMLKRGHVWPAVAQDSNASNYVGTVPMGSLFAIPASVDINALGLTAEGKALAKALQDYGAYVVDQSGSVSLYCELACDPAATDRMKFDFRKLYPHLRAVTNSSATSVGGGGTPRVQAPPAF
jgi:hypothetical protein